MITIKKLCKRYFEKGNCFVLGERRRGKDMLFANVIAYRNLDYVSNTEYQKKKGVPLTRYPLDFKKLDCGQNTYKDFIDGTIKPYTYPYPQGADIYISDCGVYLPSQFCNELNRDYKYLHTFFCLSGQLARINVHCNAQALNRIYDKAREQGRFYITSQWCKVLPIFKQQLVIQKIRIHEKYESCLNNVPKLILPFSMRYGRDKNVARLYQLNYEISHGKIEEHLMVYFNKSAYDTNVFKTMLEGVKI